MPPISCPGVRIAIGFEITSVPVQIGAADAGVDDLDSHFALAWGALLDRRGR